MQEHKRIMAATVKPPRPKIINLEESQDSKVNVEAPNQDGSSQLMAAHRALLQRRTKLT